MALDPGSIAFTGYNADGAENLSFVVLENIAAGTVIHFTDNAWNGSGFTTNESRWAWTATSDIAAGTVITMDNLAGGNGTSNLGEISYLTDPLAFDLSSDREVVYAYTGDATNPAFLAAFGNTNYDAVSGGLLTNTGLIESVTATRSFSTSADTAAYIGSHATPGDLSEFLEAVNNSARWAFQSNNADNSHDGINPDVPFSADPFVVDPAAQRVAFAAASLSVSVAEGNSGTRTVTFVVERTNGTAGEVTFSGVLTAGPGANSSDFGGAVPAGFSGTIADGASSGTVSITITGDTTFEPDESFTLELTSVANGAANVYLPNDPSVVATGTIVNDEQRQEIGFAADSLSVTQDEGGVGDTHTYTFVVERTGNAGIAGNVAFSGTIALPDTNADDFNGPLSLTFSGNIPDGQTSAIVSVTTKGDVVLENDERFNLKITSVANDAGGVIVVKPGAGTATGVIGNDEEWRIRNGETFTTSVQIGDGDHLVIEEGGKIAVTGTDAAVRWLGGETTVDNYGIIQPAATGGNAVQSNGSGLLTFNNHEGAEIKGVFNRGQVHLTNAGSTLQILSSGSTIDNLATGVITASHAGLDLLRVSNTAVTNAGRIVSAADGAQSGGDAIVYEDGSSVTVTNLSGGLIEGSRHAVTGEDAATIVNEAGGVMIGRNGSAVNIDNDATVANTITVINRGVMQGRSQNYADSDGDAVDVDGRVNIENWGAIEGLGHNGYHDGEPNVSEGVAAGAAVIVNHEGGRIYGYGRAIQIDNSGNDDAFAPSTITNDGLIQGDGNAPTDVTPEEVALFAERIRGGEAINLVGSFGDTLTNGVAGKIIGGVKMGGGDDLLTNKGTMTATSGGAVDLGEGDDTYEAYAGSTVTGLIDGGEGDDTLKLIGPGAGALGVNANFETLLVQSGVWTLQSDAYESINIAATAVATSQLRLADQGQMVMAAGGTLLTTDGGDGVIADGVANIDNAGVVQALGMQGTTAARAIVTNGGEIHNKAGGIILAQGAAIASGAVATAGVDIVNDSMIQSLSGQAIVLSGDQDDSVTNKGVITGSVDLGAGDDTLNAFTNFSISGAITGGDGDDTVNLLGAGTGSLGATSAFEHLVVQSGTWSVADGAAGFSDIVIEGGARVTSGLIFDDGGHLVVEAGGELVVAGDAITWEGVGDVVVDNAGLIEAARVLNTETSANGDFTFNNLEGGVVHGSFGPRQEVRPESVITFNNAGLIEHDDRIFDLKELVKDGAHVVINNLAGGVIQQVGGDGEEDIMLLDDNTIVNNRGTIQSLAGSFGGGDALNFDSGRGSSVHNYAGGLIEGSRHAVTGKQDFTIVNEGTMIGRNGSAVNFDTNASELVTITNRGVMEGRSAELDDSDGDAIDVDGQVLVLNYGRIAGLGAEGYHDGEPNVSEGIAVGGGSIVNNSTGEIYGYGRAIQVDDSGNGNALGASTIINDGLIQGDGHGPEGVDPDDAARFDLRGNEAINLVGDYEDFVGNNSTGRIVGGVSMGDGRDTLNNSGSIAATGGSAIDMGDGNDQLNLYVGSTVTGTILLGAGDDVANSTSASAYVIDGGDSNDSIAMYYTIFGGNDTLFGGAGDDHVSGGLGNDRIDGGLDNDTLYGENGDDVIDGGDGEDTILGGLGNDTLNGNAGDDVFSITDIADGRDKYDGGDGIDTLDYSALSTTVTLTLRDGAPTSFAGDAIKDIENVIGGTAADKLTGNALGNALTGNAGDDTLKGMAGDDVIDGGEGNDTVVGGIGNDVLRGGVGDDLVQGNAGNDEIQGGAGNDTLAGGAGLDTFVFNSVIDGIDTITDFKVSGSSEDQLSLSASMFTGFGGDNAFELIGGGFLRAISNGGTTEIQVDADGGGDSFLTLAVVNGSFGNGVLAEHVLVHQDPLLG